MHCSGSAIILSAGRLASNFASHNTACVRREPTGRSGLLQSGVICHRYAADPNTKQADHRRHAIRMRSFAERCARISSMPIIPRGLPARSLAVVQAYWETPNCLEYNVHFQTGGCEELPDRNRPRSSRSRAPVQRRELGRLPTDSFQKIDLGKLPPPAVRGARQLSAHSRR